MSIGDPLARLTPQLEAELNGELNDEWRQWVRLIFTELRGEQIVDVSNAELRRAVCAKCDEDTKALKDKIGALESALTLLRQELQTVSRYDFNRPNRMAVPTEYHLGEWVQWEDIQRVLNGSD